MDIQQVGTALTRRLRAIRLAPTHRFVELVIQSTTDRMLSVEVHVVDLEDRHVGVLPGFDPQGLTNAYAPTVLRIYYRRGIQLNIECTVRFLNPENGDVVDCSIYDGGKRVAHDVAQNTPHRPGTFATCTYTPSV